MTQNNKLEFYRLITAAIFEKPKYWTNGKAVYEVINHKYNKLSDKILEEYGVSCKEDDSQIKQFINLVEKQLNNQYGN